MRLKLAMKAIDNIFRTTVILKSPPWCLPCVFWHCLLSSVQLCLIVRSPIPRIYDSMAGRNPTNFMIVGDEEAAKRVDMEVLPKIACLGSESDAVRDF